MHPHINLREFIIQNHSFMTMADLIDETGAAHPTVKKVCDKLGLKPVTKSQQTEQTLMSYKDRMTAQKAASKMGIHVQHIRNICARAGIKMLKKSIQPEKPQHFESSISKRLGSVRTDAGNYFDPTREMGFKSDEQ